MNSELDRLMAKQESIRKSRPRLLLWLSFILMAGMFGMTVGRQVGGTTGGWAAVAVCNSLILYVMARQDKTCLELAQRLALLERRLNEKEKRMT